MDGGVRMHIRREHDRNGISAVVLQKLKSLSDYVRYITLLLIKSEKVILLGKRLYAIGRYEVSLCGLAVHKCVDPSRPTGTPDPSG